MGLYGFMEGETPQPGISDLPEGDVQMVRDTLAAMLAGEFTRFDVFAGPIMDNEGNQILAAGESLVQADLDQFPNEDGSNCPTCMYWWADGIEAALP
jgi:basic membrane protein A and related proteins